MRNKKNYKFSTTDGKVYIIFDSDGYVEEAKGFGMQMWSNLNIDQYFIGKHVDEISKILKKNGVGNAYNDFEINVHIPLLKLMLKEKENKE